MASLISELHPFTVNAPGAVEHSAFAPLPFDTYSILSQLLEECRRVQDGKQGVMSAKDLRLHSLAACFTLGAISGGM